MKAIKFFAMALVALTFMGCPRTPENPDVPQQETTLALDQTSITINVEETATINATVDATWASSNPDVATPPALAAFAGATKTPFSNKYSVASKVQGILAP